MQVLLSGRIRPELLLTGAFRTILAGCALPSARTTSQRDCAMRPFPALMSSIHFGSAGAAVAAEAVAGLANASAAVVGRDVVGCDVIGRDALVLGPVPRGRAVFARRVGAAVVGRIGLRVVAVAVPRGLVGAAVLGRPLVAATAAAAAVPGRSGSLLTDPAAAVPGLDAITRFTIEPPSSDCCAPTALTPPRASLPTIHRSLLGNWRCLNCARDIGDAAVPMTVTVGAAVLRRSGV